MISLNLRCALIDLSTARQRHDTMTTCSSNKIEPNTNGKGSASLVILYTAFISTPRKTNHIIPAENMHFVPKIHHFFIKTFSYAFAY